VVVDLPDNLDRSRSNSSSFVGSYEANRGSREQLAKQLVGSVAGARSSLLALAKQLAREAARSRSSSQLALAKQLASVINPLSKKT
jgi:hypothetical protein